MTEFIVKNETLCKTITYCFMHFCVAIIVAFALTSSWAIAFSIGIVEPLVQTMFFNLHERGWNKARETYKRSYMDGGLGSV